MAKQASSSKTKREVVAIRLNLPAEIHRRLKVEAAKRQTTMHDQLVMVLDRHLPKIEGK